MTRARIAPGGLLPGRRDLWVEAETSLRHAYDMVHLHHISVRPEFRRRGVGAALLAAVRAAANEAGITLFTLDVWTFNTAARAFFARNGFTAYNERLWSR